MKNYYSLRHTTEYKNYNENSLHQYHRLNSILCNNHMVFWTIFVFRTFILFYSLKMKIINKDILNNVNCYCVNYFLSFLLFGHN